MRPSEAASHRARVALGSLLHIAAEVTSLLVGVVLMALIDTPEAARRLARAIASDLSL